jgi:hypothetical protein
VLLHRLRRVRLLPVLLAVGLLIGTSVPGAHDAADDVCERPPSAADHAASVDDARWQPAPAHCEVCHWLRSLRTLDVPTTLALLSPAGAAHDVAESPERAPRDSRSTILPRGPPA